MLTFLKRERALRMLPWSALFTVVLVVPLSGVFMTDTYRATRDDLLSLHGLVAMMTLQAVIFLAARDFPIRVRVREWERALPVTMRRVVLERLASVWLTLFATYFAGSLVWLVNMPEGATLGDHAQMVWRGFVASGVSAALLGCYRPTRPALSALEAVLVSIVSVAAWLYSGFSFLPGIDVVYLAVLIGLLLFLWNALPASSAPLDPSIKAGVSGATKDTEANGSPESTNPLVHTLGALRWTIVRSTLLRPHTLLLALATGFYLWSGSGALAMSAMFLAMLPYQAMRMGLNVLYGLDALPIRRERILRVAGLASLGLLLAMAAAFSRADRQIPNYKALTWGVKVDKCFEEVWGQDQDYRTHVKVPASEWRMTRDPSKASITAPWGETVAPTLHPIFPGAETFIYNPYDVQPGSTGRLLVWQVARALEQVHGQSDGFNDRYDEWADAVALKGPIGEARIDDVGSADWGYEVSEHPVTSNGAGFAALGAVLVWLLAVGFALLPNVPSRATPAWLERLPRGTWAMALLSVLVVSLLAVEMNDHALLPVIVDHAHAWIDERLGSSPVRWAALVFSLAAVSYTFLAWRIQRIEIPPLARNGWTKKPFAVY